MGCCESRDCDERRIPDLLLKSRHEEAKERRCEGAIMSSLHVIGGVSLIAAHATPASILIVFGGGVYFIWMGLRAGRIVRTTSRELWRREHAEIQILGRIDHLSND
jgi:hypothetical protein